MTSNVSLIRESGLSAAAVRMVHKKAREIGLWDASIPNTQSLEQLAQAEGFRTWGAAASYLDAQAKHETFYVSSQRSTHSRDREKDFHVSVFTDDHGASGSYLDLKWTPSGSFFVKRTVQDVLFISEIARPSSLFEPYLPTQLDDAQRAMWDAQMVNLLKAIALPDLNAAAALSKTLVRSRVECNEWTLQDGGWSSLVETSGFGRTVAFCLQPAQYPTDVAFSSDQILQMKDDASSVDEWLAHAPAYFRDWLAAVPLTYFTRDRLSTSCERGYMDRLYHCPGSRLLVDQDEHGAPIIVFYPASADETVARLLSNRTARYEKGERDQFRAEIARIGPISGWRTDFVNRWDRLVAEEAARIANSPPADPNQLPF